MWQIYSRLLLQDCSSHTSSVVTGQGRAFGDVQDPCEGIEECETAHPERMLLNETGSRLTSALGDGPVPSAAHFTGPSGLFCAPVEPPALSHVGFSRDGPVSLTATWIESEPTPFSCAHTVVDPSAFDQLIVDGLDSHHVLDSVNVEIPLPTATGPAPLVPSIDLAVAQRCSSRMTLESVPVILRYLQSLPVMVLKISLSPLGGHICP